MMPRRSTFHAFTLVEMLAAVVIILVVAALFVPAVGSIKNKALLTGCAQNLRQVGLALQGYAQENSGNYPPTWSPPWSQVLVEAGYVTDTRIFLCPGDTLNQVTPNASTGQSMGRSYSYCSIVMTGNTYDPTQKLNKNTIDQPSKQYLVTEWHNPDFSWLGGNGLIRGWGGPAEMVSPTHVGGCNFLFADGHAEWRTQEKVNNPYSGWLLNQIIGN